MKAASKYIKELRWYDWCCLIIPWIRVYQLSYGAKLVPRFENTAHMVDGALCGYTYQDAWYYVWARVLEAMLYFTIFKHTKYTILIFPAVLSFLKIFDERNTPFNFGVSELWSLIIGVAITSICMGRDTKTTA